MQHLGAFAQGLLPWKTKIYRMGHEKVARLPFCTCPCYCINFCIYAMVRSRAILSWPTLYYIFRLCICNLNYLECKSHAPCYIAIYDLYDCTMFFHVI